MVFVWKEISSFLCTLFFLINTILVFSTQKRRLKLQVIIMLMG